MSSKKQITIDPSGLSGGQATAHNATLKRQRKIKPPVALLRPSTVKKNLLEKIKDYKRHNEETPSREQHAVPKSDKDLANQFKTSANYLEQLINKKREARKPHKSKTPTATKQPFQQQQQQPFQQQQQQPFQQQQQQPFQQQQQQPFQQQQQQQQQPVQVSLDLPPELQINPVNPFYPTQTELPFESFVPSVSEQFNPSPQPSQPQPSQPSQPSQLSHSNVLKDVPYGCLRNGIKPTYRTYHREMQKHNHLDNNNNATMNKTMKRGLGDAPNPNNQVSLNINPESDEMMQIQERQRKLRELQERAAANNAVNTATNDPAANDPAANDPAANDPITLSLSNDATSSETETNQISRPMRIKNKIRQTITKKYNLGRAPGSNVVGVLIKNNETRRQVQQEHGVLRRESIVEIRKYLHDHGLLKVGSDAPPDVLRNMYENAKLTGDVNNVNKHVMLHNFIATADSAPDHN